MKILFDAHTFGLNKTGIESYPRSLATHLKENKTTNVTLYSAETPFPQQGIGRILYGFEGAIKLYNPDLIHVHNFAPLRHTIPTVTTVYDLCFRKCPTTYSLKNRIAFSLLFEKSIHNSDRIICISHEVKKMLIHFYRVDSEKIDVIYPAADSNFEQQSQKTHKFNPLTPYFLVVGDINKRKKTDEIIQAYETLLSTHNHIKLVFVGPKTDEYVRKFPHLGNNLIGLGYLDKTELPSLYAGARALIYNSICEGFGLPLIEAMNTATPVICRDIPIFKEVAETSALYSKNVNELSAQMSKVLSEDTYRSLSKESSLRSKAFSWDNTIQATINTYEKAYNTFHTKKRN